MELLVQLIFVFAIFKYCLKASFIGGFRTMLLYALGAGVWALVWYPVVIQLPMTIVERLLTDREIVADGAVWTTIEAILGIMLSIYLLDNYFAPKQKRRKTLFVMKVVPGILTPMAILYFELMFFKFRVGGDFLWTSVLYSVLATCGIFLVSLFLKKAVEGESMKLELKLLINLAILFVGLLINSAVADYNVSAAHTETEWLPLVVCLGASFLIIWIGYLCRNISLKHIFSQILNHGFNH